MLLVFALLLGCSDKKEDEVKLAPPPNAPTTATPTPGEAPPAPTGPEPTSTEIAPGVTAEAPRIASTNVDRMYARHVLVMYQGAVSAKPNVKRTRDEARALAEQVLAKAKAGENFAQLAREYSDDGSAERGGYLGGFGKGVMVEPFEMAVRSLAIGQISAVVESPFGFHVIKREPVTEVHAAHLLVTWKGAQRAPSGVNRSKEEAKARVEEAIAKLKGGENWTKLVETYSDAPLKDDGGDLGWLGRGQVAPELEKVVFDLAPGSTSDVVETPIGFHVLRRVE